MRVQCLSVRIPFVSSPSRRPGGWAEQRVVQERFLLALQPEQRVLQPSRRQFAVTRFGTCEKLQQSPVSDE